MKEVYLPRYLMQVVGKDSHTYRYNPPVDAIEAGVLERHSFGATYDIAVAQANIWNAELDEWRKEVKHLSNLCTRSRVGDLIKAYTVSISFNKLSAKAKLDYTYSLNNWSSYKLAGVSLFQARLGDIAAPMCQRVYDQHILDKGLSNANHSLAVYKLVFNFAIRSGFIQFNPFEKIKKINVKHRRTTWEKEHVKAFMDVSFASFKKRSLGLIVYMAYEWAQRLGDMRMLTWDMYNLETGVLSLEQSKRRARVQLPTSPELQAMLKQQHAEYGWQAYIAPSAVSDRKGGLVPYSLINLGRVGKIIMKEAKLPDDLMLMDLRRTAITELIEAGVPISNIMSLSGHATPMSLTPYMKNTLKSSTLAQTMRGTL